MLGKVFAAPAEIDLSGEWQVSLQTPESAGASWQSIRLPGTLDDAGIGTPLTLKPELTLQVLTRLQRKFTYTGPAWYRRTVDIPADWAGRRIVLELERVLWESRVWVDGHEVSRGDSLTTPHRHDLSTMLSPGRHLLLVRIDNSEIYPGLSHHARTYKTSEDAPLAHAYTNHTQTIWNGVLGTLRLRAEPLVAITDLAVFPRLTPSFGVKLRFKFSEPTETQLQLTLRRADGTVVAQRTATAAAEIDWPLPADAGVRPWDEFSPALYSVEARLKSDDSIASTVTFGFRELAAVNREFRLNAHRIFLRGNLECAIFPLTGYPPTDVATWKELIATAKSWGLNHFRFHSWCPPQAAFIAADESGFYLQVELPHWSLEVGKDPATWSFVENEALRILGEYGNHPSFMFLSLGNELQGDFGKLCDLERRLQSRDARRLYTSTSFSFQAGHGKVPEATDDYLITQYTPDGWIRGQGVFNEQAPSFNGNYSHASARTAVPLVAHEVGQYSVYPDLSEIARYTGNLVPLNFVAIRDDLAEKALLPLAPQFTAASGRFAALLYKEEIERALRTPELDGFQLLQLQDFPGQGTALVGLLNAFWKSKGIITPEEFRQFCGPVVPLARFPKAVYTRGENFSATIEIANYFRDFPAAQLDWKIQDDNGTMVSSGRFRVGSLEAGKSTSFGEINVPIPAQGPAARWRLTAALAGTEFRNGWNIWVYPAAVAPAPTGVRITTSLAETLEALAAGDRVFFSPPLAELGGISGKFVPVFWSPVHFPNQPGTMGILCEPTHAALRGFPTDSYSDWQWWDLTLRSHSMIIDGLAATPIVRVIDNFNRNHSLANVFEARVGKGRLLFSAIDLTNDLSARPTARQLRDSLLRYAASEEFRPVGELTPTQLRALMRTAQTPDAGSAAPRTR